ncbi:hypothetical protein ACF0H5_005726 [Mactra antiquata]
MSSDLDNPGVKAVITLGVLAFVGVVAVITAKIVRVCMDDRYSDDSDSVMSENTRDLIRARLSVIQFKKKELKKEKRQKTLNAFKKWKEFVRVKKKVGASDICTKGDDCVVNIEKVNGVNGINGIKHNGTIGNKSTIDHKTENSNLGPTRLPSFTAKTQPSTPRPPQNSQKLTPTSAEMSSPVARGRPVSSKGRALPNVTQTDLKRDQTTISLKAVQYEDNTSSSNNKANVEVSKT